MLFPIPTRNVIHFFISFFSHKVKLFKLYLLISHVVYQSINSSEFILGMSKNLVANAKKKDYDEKNAFKTICIFI